MIHTSTNTILPLIADVGSYHPNTINMVKNAAARDYWLNVFDNHTHTHHQRILDTLDDATDAQQRADAFSEHFNNILAELRADHTAHGPISIIKLCQLRRQCLLDQNVLDPYKSIKDDENATALKLLPDLLTEIDALPQPDRWLTLIQNCFAGNIFDLGCEATINLYNSGEIDFHKTRQQLQPRPWAVDNFDNFHSKITQPNPYNKAVLFVDNAGADIVLGMIPLTRELLRLNTQIILTANTHPALNDITHTELIDLVNHIATLDPIFADALDSQQLTLIPSGNDLPVIDMTQISPELADAAQNADLLIIEGMGRALETNFDTRFTCDTLKIAMIKEQDVADLLNAQLYNVACRFDPA